MGVVCAQGSYAIADWSITLGRSVTPDDWRWVMMVAASPAVVGVLVPLVVRESPAWLHRRTIATDTKTPVAVVFRPPYLRRTLIGIVLSTVALFGGWGSINWAVNWSDAANPLDQNVKAHTQFMRSFGAIFGSFCGGWLAMMLGRRLSYFLICLGSLLASGYLYWFLTPADPLFLRWMFVVGVVATTAFGWLPLYLPELFPTEVRATGSGVSFNFGPRILTVIGVLGTGYLLMALSGDYARAGRITHLVFLVGMIAIFFAPDTSRQSLDPPAKAGENADSKPAAEESPRR
jgi:MFS family permease